jgi:hypothetical protein
MKNSIPSKAGFSLAALVPPLALILAAASFTGCLFGGSSEESAVDIGEETGSEEYSVSGNRIIKPGFDVTNRYCDGDSMHVDTYRVGADTVEFSISGEVLSINDSRVHAHPHDAIIQWTSLFMRIGSGSGLEGSWLYTGREYRVVSGALASEEKAELDRQRDYRGPLFELNQVNLLIGGGLIRSYRDRPGAKIFMAIWNGAFTGTGDQADSARYAIAVKEADRNTVELKGLKSGETVRVEETPESTTYTSDQGGHATHVFSSNPKTCPNETHPEWYEQFKSANLKNPLVLEKTGEKTSKRQHSFGIPFVPLKSIHSLLN